ncbi:MAG: thiolase family protein [Saprospiraceae bacterium]|nr:thiolase family protein [Saprospiraceae bacterium]
MKNVYIVSAVRTPIGSFGGQFAGVSATKLGAAAIKGALEKGNVPAEQVEEVFMGNVLSANLGQAPARQAAIFAGLSNTVPCTTVNKVCSSGAKAIMFAAQSIMLGDKDVVVAGGMENMSQVPYYMPKARYGQRYGHGQLNDGLVLDGLTDVYNQSLMGVCADATASKFDISREEQDAFAIQSYTRTAAAAEAGNFGAEIVPVEVPQRRGDALVIDTDEEYKKVKFEKIPALRAAFSKEGTVTAANASTINDGASALVLMSEDKMNELGLKPLAKILAFADAAHEPEWFTTAPPVAARKALDKAGLKTEDMDLFEVNEAFSVVTMAFNREMGISEDKVNVNGGAVSLGHPLGTSGARIVTTLVHALGQNNGKYGLAAICNGGGGASSLIVERM